MGASDIRHHNANRTVFFFHSSSGPASRSLLTLPEAESVTGGVWHVFFPTPRSKTLKPLLPSVCPLTSSAIGDRLNRCWRGGLGGARILPILVTSHERGRFSWKTSQGSDWIRNGREKEEGTGGDIGGVCGFGGESSLDKAVGSCQ